ncbi:hypothetical protein D8674_041609 [Pyrus ussuriensis x Pyrus communis]|uniref:BAH domain-containing protein n=1 Tax=Pyrus ussuriensis x Pyrus communis TaxID=2448454 RepID=A0A5N5HA01_9ROSA|nr:hypothetical protein D8674_041609 [Pyrus ussuriensis x Pyrus communis]
MHGSPAEKSIRRRHMWPVPHSSATTVASDLSTASDSFSKDGRKICVGDCALFKPPQDSPPFIGIIRRLILDKEERLCLGVNWLYRPADVKLSKGVSLEATPNEVFYSFHKDEIPAASLLHPCKVAFLRKGVELPSGISSFVCRRVYDTENNCLWWLTDKDFINERQEEVDQLLDKTRLEMHGAVQSGGRSPKPLNTPSSTPQIKSGSDSLQNSTSPFSSQVKGKKRERGDQGSEPAKRERLVKIEDGESGQSRPENMLKSELGKITDKGGLLDTQGVEKFVQLMKAESADKKIDLAGRRMLVDVIAVTDRLDCLGQFVQRKGLCVLDEWLQEVHKGKLGDGSSPKESDKSVEEFLFALLCALEKVPVNLHALQTCNVGKSVNNLRSYRNSEIQKKARSLVDMWKKRVEAEMNLNETKTGSSRGGVSWPTKHASSEVSHVGSRKIGSSSEVGTKSSTMQPSVSKTPQIKLGCGETVSKSSGSPGSTKLLSISSGNLSKDQNFRTLGAGTSDLPLTPIKEERSSSSSQSQNNSQSSDHARNVGSLYREDARSSSAGSVSASKISASGSRHRKSSNGVHGSPASGVKKETGPGKACTLSRSLTSEKASTVGVSYEKHPEAPMIDHGNNRLIVRLPNTGRSPARGASGCSFEDPVNTASPPAEKHDNHDQKYKHRSDALHGNRISDVNSDAFHSKEGLSGSEDGNVLPLGSEQNRAGEDGEKRTEASKATGSSSKLISRTGKSYEASLSSMNALIESCVKFSEGRGTASPSDDVGMNLLASVAAGEMSKSENVSPSGSPGRNSPVHEESFSENDAKLKPLGKETADIQCQPNGGVNSGATKLDSALDSLRCKSEARHSLTHLPTNGFDVIVASYGGGDKPAECNANLNCSSNKQQNSDGQFLRADVNPGESCDASASEPPSCARKEGHLEAEGSNQSHEQGKLRTPNDERTVGSSTPVVSEAASGSVKVEQDIGISTCSSSQVAGENHDVKKDSNSALLTEQKPSVVAGNHSESKEGKSEEAVLCSGSGNTLHVESKGEQTDDIKAAGHTTQTGKETRDIYVPDPEDSRDFARDATEGNEAFVDCSDLQVSKAESPSMPVKENEQHDKSSKCKPEVIESGKTEERQVSCVNSLGSDTAVKLDFDLNEGFPVDDGSQPEFVKAGDPGTSSSVHFPCPLPFQMSSVSGSFPASITVVAPAKGSFVPPENLMRSTGELGWKGSSTTSAFRPAEPRRNVEASVNATDAPIVDTASSKQVRPPLDFDLNVPDQRVYEEVVQNSAHVMGFKSDTHDRGSGGLDLDLNRVDESPDVGLLVSNSCRLDIPPLPSRSSVSGGLSNGGVNDSRDFDLNNGPGLDEVGTDTAPCAQHLKTSMLLSTPASNLRINSPDFGNLSAWFPQGNSYSAITVPPMFPGRGEQSYGAPAGSQRIVCPPTGNASTAVPFPPATTFQYPGFPFETSFSLSSSSFSGSTAYIDSSSGGALCFPSMPSQMVGPGGVVSSSYPRPYMMSLPGGSSNVGLDGRKWGSHGLDLNAGPGATETERRAERLPSGMRQLSVPSSQAPVEEQLKLFQVGGALKRKEPDSGLDAVERIGYKQPSWQ